MDLSTESDWHFILSKILYVRWEESEIFLLRNTQVALGIQSSLRWGWQGGTAAVAMTMAGSLQRHCTRFKSNPCKSQNPVQCSKNSDKIPNHLLISNLKKHCACKKGMQVVKDSTSARDEIQKHNVQEFFREPPRFWKTTSTVHYRQGRILCSREDGLSVKQKPSIPAVTQFHRMLKNDRDAREGKGLVPSILTKRISQLLTVRSGAGGLQMEL